MPLAIACMNVAMGGGGVCRHDMNIVVYIQWMPLLDILVPS